MQTCCLNTIFGANFMWSGKRNVWFNFQMLWYWYLQEIWQLRRDHWQKTARLILLKVGQSTWKNPIRFIVKRKRGVASLFWAHKMHVKMLIWLAKSQCYGIGRKKLIWSCQGSLLNQTAYFLEEVRAGKKVAGKFKWQIDFSDFWENNAHQILCCNTCI